MALILKTIPGDRGRATPAAAASLARIDAQRKTQHLAPLPIASAYRSDATQEQYKKWWAAGVGPQHGLVFKPAWYPPYPHASGLFIDTSARAWMLTFGRAHGWRQTVAGDKVHFGYFTSLDKKKPKKVLDPDPTNEVYRLESTGPANPRYYRVGSFKRYNTRDPKKADKIIAAHGYGGILPFAEIVKREAALRAKYGVKK